MTVTEFIAIWQKADLTERSGCQQHFCGLCRLLGHPEPVEADPTGESFTFERGAEKNTGGDGFADVWKKGCFGWEYKGKHKNLDTAYQQLLRYAQALENPPLMVVCDMERIIIRTNFTNTPTVKYEIALAALAKPENLAILRNVFFEPEKLKPGVTIQSITTEAARHLAEIAQSMRKRGLPALDVAHFLDRMIFCLFAEDVGLLPRGLFSRVLKNSQHDPALFRRVMAQLFEAMADGGLFGEHKILHFNGNLFSDATVLDMEAEEIERIAQISTLDWSAVDPSIFGTLFERGLDPDKRSQLGAHYTSREDIEVLVEPVVMQPLRREWAEIRQTCDNLLSTGKKNPAPEDAGKKPSPAVRSKAAKQAKAMIGQFLHMRLPSLKVLDPACGSGNFLYVTLQKLKDLEKEVVLYGARNGMGGFLPMVGPWQLYGIEINPYAYELAQMTVWIGYLQWVRDNGLGNVGEPVLRKLDNFKCMDAIIDLSDPNNPKEPEWPKVDYIVGNPPFLGGKMLRRELGDEYVDRMLALWRERVPAEGDLCCYWFEKARLQIEKGLCKQAGLLATQGIRGGANREVIERIKETGGIFFAESDRAWVLDGANVHISMIGFDAGDEKVRTLDGKVVETINANLTASTDTTQAERLHDCKGVSFMGDTKGGAFDIGEAQALELLRQPNPHGKPNSDIVVPWANGLDVTRRPRDMWIVDYGIGMSEQDAALYEKPYNHIKAYVKPEREKNNRESYRRLWWQHVEARPEMRRLLAPIPRFLATLTVSKHRLFVWFEAPTLPDHQLIIFARADDCFFGILHSRPHEVWALKLGTRLETRPRYTPTTCFETFPLPKPMPDQEKAIADAAKELDALRNNWLSPSEWMREENLEFPGSVNGPWARYVVNPNDKGIGTVRYRRLVPKDEPSAKLLAKRTLTNLYNARPDWLKLAHQKLDEAVFAAYGWSPALTDEQLLENLLALNQQRAAEDDPSR
ncbi:MAG: class I SAM-dependent DNA methyltransferase [Candidatus Brocadiia bacterium]